MNDHTPSAKTFAAYQPIYAEHGIATVPLAPIVNVSVKRPCIEKAQQVDLAESGRLVRKFPSAGVAFWAGKRNRITVLDVDSKRENDLADAMTRFGQSPFVVRTGAKGGFHAYYRHNGEAHEIKPEDGKPWDILTNSLVVAPPTSCVATSRNYQIIQGALDDLDDLPVMCDAPKVPKGQRNKQLWMHCMRHAPHCDTLNALLDVAITFNTESCAAPLPDSEVARIARSAWEYTEKGLNRFGKHGAYVSTDEVDRLLKLGGMDAVALATLVRAHNGPNAKFFLANGYAKALGWSPKRFAKARKQVAASGFIRRTHGPSQGPHWFRFGPRLVEIDQLSSKNTTSPTDRGESVVSIEDGWSKSTRRPS